MKVETASEHFFFMTLRIQTEESVGTGFIFQHKWPCPRSGEELTGMFLVSNKHVVAGSGNGTLRFTRRGASEAEPDLGNCANVALTRREWGWWDGHPEGDVDVAVLPLNPILHRMKESCIEPFYSFIDAKLLPENSPFGDLNAIERVLFVGYPEDIYDAPNNLPLIRSGVTASPPAVDYEGQPRFLIDASVFPGSSGSPIFAYDRGAWLSGSRDWVVGSERVVFLGVLASVLYRESDGSLEFRDIPTAMTPVPVSHEMIDLGVAFKTVTVVETIEARLRSAGQL